MPEPLVEEALPVVVGASGRQEAGDKPADIVHAANNSANGGKGSKEAGDKLADIVHAGLAMLVLLCLAPLLSLVALLVKLTSSGPVFYRGLRVGKDRRTFTIYKFRTLVEGAEAKIGARLLDDADDYYTPIGRFLKRTKLDEWPQLWNVFRGDMRLVGPRPVRPIFVEKFLAEIPHYGERFRMKPGITGLAQLRGGYFTHPRDKLRYELRYIRHRSLLLDLKILLLTAIKLCHRWLSLGLLFFALFLFVSFIPASLLSAFYVTLWGVRFNIVHALIGLMVILAGWFLIRRLPHNRLSLYHTSLYLPMGLFILFSCAAAWFSVDPIQALRGAGYYGVTGFLIALWIVNSNVTRRFVRQAMSVVAATAVVISAIGVLKLLLVDYLTSAEASFAARMDFLYGSPGISATLGSPAVLATYLTLAVPYLLCRLAQAREQGERDFWMAGAIITFFGIVLTKSPLGLCAAVLAMVVYMSKYFRRGALSVFVLAISPFLVLSVLSNGFLPSLPHLLLGYGARTLRGSWSDVPTSLFLPSPPDSGYLTLLLEHGLLGGVAMLWVIAAALFSIYHAYRATADAEIRSILWAVFCSILGFLVSLVGFNAFSNLTLQVLFWGTIGIGVGVVTHLSGRRRELLIDIKLGQ